MSQPEPLECVGIILDGNRRWAKGKGLPNLEGHRQGFETLKTITRAVRERGIPHLAVYAFSTENWNRPPDEIAGLMNLIKEAARIGTKDLIAEGVRVRFVGNPTPLTDDVREVLETVEAESASNREFTLWICISYGGRAEIVAAAEAAGVHEGLLSEELIRQHMWTAEMPDPDLIIRTGGQKRLSNFLLWQSAYSELFFVDMLWPDFTEGDLDTILEEYDTRQRNFGV
jgi:undecaprenyl diphosphate synthase